MRKLRFFVLFISCFLCMENTWAACQLTTCENNGDKGKGWSVVDTRGRRGNNASGQCYRCNWGDNAYECSENTVIAIYDPNYSFNKKINNIFYCSDSGDYNDDWVEWTPSDTCSNSEVMSGASNVDKYYSLKNQQGPSNNNTRIIGSRSEACVMYKCKNGYAPNANKTDCVKVNNNCKFSDGISASTGYVINNGNCDPLNPSTGLKSTSHVKSGKVCKLECVAGGWNVTLNSNACDSDYEPSSDKKECVLTAAAKQSQQQKQQQQNEAKKEQCENSGGTLSGNACKCAASKNLKKSGDTCVCLDDVNYTWDAASKSCKITNEAALKKACEAAAATGAYMEDGKCKCSDRDTVWKGDKCVKNTEIKRCKSATGTKWDYDKNECICKDTKTEYDSDSNTCVETEEAKKQRLADENQEKLKSDQEKSRKTIGEIKDKINQLKAGLGTSVWKNKEGNFNTARLASDSIAGVVLGTAGGLITSNIIKKNQIKGGFEDISCTIGGQTVAGYGDQFQVGIQ